MSDNINKVVDRGEKLDDLGERAGDTHTHTHTHTTQRNTHTNVDARVEFRPCFV